MAYALSLLLDDVSAAAVRRQWEHLSAIGLSRSMIDLGYPPHVTLAVYDALDGRAAPTLNGIFAGQAELDVALTLTETFGAESGVIYAALAPSEALRRLHRAVAGAVSAPCRAQYQPRHWVPHCTLATGLSAAALEQAQQVLQQSWQSFSGVFRCAELVQFAPVKPIKRWVLQGPGSETGRDDPPAA